MGADLNVCVWGGHPTHHAHAHARPPTDEGARASLAPTCAPLPLPRAASMSPLAWGEA